MRWNLRAKASRLRKDVVSRHCTACARIESEIRRSSVGCDRTILRTTYADDLERYEFTAPYDRPRAWRRW